MRMRVALSVVLGLVAGVAMADESGWKKMLEKKVYEKDGRKLPYRQAKLGTGGRVPLLLFLHGAGERGDDNEAQLLHGVRDLLKWCEAEEQDCVVVAPQCPEGLWWSNYGGNWKVPEETEMKSAPSWPMALVCDVVDDLVKGGGIDPDRIYITGLSMGGYGTFDVICRRPGFFAAAVPVCGGGDPDQASEIKDLPLWVFHGGQDGVVPPEMSRAMVEAVRKAGGKPKYLEYPGVGHDSWSATYANPDVWKWLFGQRK